MNGTFSHAATHHTGSYIISQTGSRIAAQTGSCLGKTANAVFRQPTKMVYRLLPLALGFAWLSLSVNDARAEVYRWKKPDGSVVYSDEPHPDAEVVTVKPLPTVNLPVVTLPAGSSPPPSEPATPYTDVKITTPANDEVIRDPTGNVATALAINPGLQQGHQVQCLLDGAPHGSPQAGGGCQYQNLDRGTHQLGATILDEQGEVIISSEPVSVHVKRHSTLAR